ncbi:MAG: NADH:flavin oxidoreductase [Rhodovulum sulfidophilum]|uniref:NADH:flavin oxidoreductase n=1 Tax=Rhodovulum sulfidophilum TaxID=35806 RepID=A0A2W5PP24_RHOSU|nr:MAG: NADH:flavin oxidoreductase [Rhodovulum sulfidophilum]
MELANRMVVAAMGVSLAEEDGTAGDRYIAYHAAQARGGSGLIITGVTGVAWPCGVVQPNQLGISEDRFLPGLRRMTEAVHGHGARIAAQLHHGGLVAAYAARWGQPLWAPSMPGPFEGDFFDHFLPDEIAAFAGGAMPEVRVLDEEDIRTAVRQFADGAVRAREAGFDACEIHGGHGYLLSSFLSPSTNKRTDAYGGSLENRARLMIETLRAVRAAVGADFPVWVKLDSREIGKKVGTTLEDARRVARMLEENGADAIAVTAYHDMGQAKLHSGSNIPHLPESNLPAAKEIKRAVGIPVIASGRVELDRAEAHLAAGGFDFLAMGRKILADPDLPNKLAAGQAAEIRPCVYCYTCVSTAYLRDHVRCAVNPATGYEYLQPRAEAPRGRRYVVVGGGPGGMEAARRLDALGNEVILIERGARLGGTLRFAALPYPPNERLLDWLEARVAASGVKVLLRTEATPELLRGLQPDEVIVATGARRDLPDIPGAELGHVLSGDDLRGLMLGEVSGPLRAKTGLATRMAARIGAATGLTSDPGFVRRATHWWMPLGKRVAIIGGELVGLELAEFLNERGREVTVIEESANFGRGLSVVRRMRLTPELREHGVALVAGAREIGIGREAVSFTQPDGARREVRADSVIVAMGACGDATLAQALRAAGFSVREVGDCTGVAYIEGAIRGAARAVLGGEAAPLPWEATPMPVQVAG